MTFCIELLKDSYKNINVVKMNKIWVFPHCTTSAHVYKMIWICFLIIFLCLWLCSLHILKKTHRNVIFYLRSTSFIFIFWLNKLESIEIIFQCLKKLSFLKYYIFPQRMHKHSPVQTEALGVNSCRLKSDNRASPAVALCPEESLWHSNSLPLSNMSLLLSFNIRWSLLQATVSQQLLHKFICDLLCESAYTTWCTVLSGSLGGKCKSKTTFHENVSENTHFENSWVISSA